MSLFLKTTKSTPLKNLFLNLFQELNFKTGKRVFIKPNLSAREPILPGENTSLGVARALAEALLESGAEKITFGHGALLGSFDHQFTFDQVVKSSGFSELDNGQNVFVRDLDLLPRQEVKIDEMVFHLPLDFINKENDTYINLAKIKTHMETGISFSLKNQMGLPSPIDRVNMHKTDLESTIAKLAVHCRPNLNILEGLPAMEENGPHHGKPKTLGFIAAGTDMVEIDSFVCGLLEIDYKNIRHLCNAERLGVGKFVDQETIEKFKEYKVDDFIKASKVFKFGRTISVYPTYSCSRCISAVNFAGKEFKKRPLKYWRVLLKAMFSKKRTNIIFGRADELIIEEGLCICVGNCAKRFAEKQSVEFLDKCPPSIVETREYIIKKINSD